ncbi:MAG: hypothetical protein IPO19_00325 [Rhodoferax sp.]|nr:hypothetical protein [Rhodoferax sp.]
MLLQVHHDTGQAKWLQTALARFAEFERHERLAWHETGFLWNDHAVASRIAVVIQLWALVRSDAALTATHGPALLAFAQRSGRLLAAPGHFTVRTNHGVMQNIALLQLAAAFPDLPEARAWQRTAAERLQMQRRFYLSPEGVVLEHSAGYHAMGAKLLIEAHRLLNQAGLPGAEEMKRESDSARTVLEQLLRPNGTLPAVGNTDGALTHRVPMLPQDAKLAPESGPWPSNNTPALAGFYPAAGWAVWWAGQEGALRASQLLTTWAKHDGHGHKTRR